MNILSIGGSDPSSGAGVQGDVRVLSGLGAHCVSVVTAVTSQNTSSYSATMEVPVSAIRDQMESVLDDFEIDAVKVGMIYGAAAMRYIASALGGIGAPVVADPVLISTTGGALMRSSALGAYCTKILPLVDVLTPNLAEAETVSGVRGVDKSARALIKRGAKSVIVTGLDCGRHVCDHVYAPKKTMIRTRTPRLAQSHGGGCAHSAAVAFAMAQGQRVVPAARFARKFVESHIATGARPGSGVTVPGTADAPHIAQLHESIMSFCATRGAHKLIPECQSNFVLAPPGAATPADMLGVRGRITRAGTAPVMAGSIARGGSRHVAGALAAMREKFGDVSACMNIRRTPQILAATKRAGLRAVSYDRALESASQSRREGATVPWGVSSAISGMRTAPDIIHHAGAHGKEPMILVFGHNTDDVLRKVRRIIAALPRPYST